MSKSDPAQNETPALKKLLCALILGADHAVTAQEMQKTLQAVAEDDIAEALQKEKEVSDDELQAVQEGIAANAESTEAADADSVAIATKPPAENLRLISDTVKVPSLSAIKTALRELQVQFHELDTGIALTDSSDGFRFQTTSECGKWLRRMLNKGKPQRLPRSAIETLAIIAYRQPVARSEIESIRGVSAGHVIKALMEMQLVRIIGRSDLPGRPFLFGTTQSFLDHFGLKTLDELEPALKREQ